MLVARRNEQRRIGALLDAAREGMSGALVLVGEPGIGKTSLLEHAAASAAGFQVLRACGVQSEAELPFAALLEVSRPILATLERLESRQAESLRAAFGLSDDEATTPFAIGAATLSLLAAAAEERPLLLLVDDAHWLDRASAEAFAFAIRRLHADAVAALFAMRPGEGRPFSARQLPELELESLDPTSAAELLAAMRGELEPAERAAVLALAQGNPLALLELPRDAANTDPHAEPVRVGKRLERAFRARAESLPAPTRDALLIAAADSTGELGVVQKALARCGLSLEALEPAEAAGLVVLEAAAVGFRHSLVRAARLSEPGEARLRRLSAAADSAWLAGRTANALSLIEEALAHTGDEPRRGELLYLRGTIQHFGGFSADAAATLDQAAALLTDSNPHLACLSLTQANGSLLAAGEVQGAVALSQHLVEIADPTQPTEFLLASLAHGSALLMDGRPEEGLPFLRDAADAVSKQELSSDPRNLPWAAMAAYWLGDITSMASYASAASRWAREHAAVATLSFAARLHARAQLITGRWSAARASLEESLDAARIAGLMNQQMQSLALLAWLDAAQGHEAICRRRIEEARAIADRINLLWRNDLLRAFVLLELSTGLVKPLQVEGLRGALGNQPLLRDAPASATLPELVEALIRAGDANAAAELLEPFSDEAERIDQPYPQALALRCRGLLAAEDAYEGEFQRALEHHALDVNLFATARTRLAYGERLRRSGRRIDARRELNEAIGVFDSLDAHPWSERARGELRATGERVSARGPATNEELTPQELQVAMLVADGKTNREVGKQLFLSPKTIEWHLGHVYRKLGISSRGKLLRVLEEQQLISPLNPGREPE